MIIVESELSDLGSKTGICDQCGKFMYGRCVTGGLSYRLTGKENCFCRSCVDTNNVRCRCYQIFL